jgi:hypothetical protein
MLNTKLKNLIKHATEVILMFQKVGTCDRFELIPFTDSDTDGCEQVTIIISGSYLLDYEFLEPLSTYCVRKDISWSIRQEDQNKFYIELY